MQKLIAELTRLYLPAGANAADALARRMAGQAAPAPTLVTDDGRTRAIVLHFNRVAGGGHEQHWERLCAVANAVQAELGLPAPAVSISGVGYDLWLSLDEALPLAQVDAFAALLLAAGAPEADGRPSPAQAGDAPTVLPPCPLPGGDKWAAFIHPDLGAAFADEPGLDIAPPPAGQAALLEGLHSIRTTQFEHALQQLQRQQQQQQQQHGAASVNPAASTGAPAQEHAATGATPAGTSTATSAGSSAASIGCAATQTDATPPGLLLKDATLDDIVRFLHARNIEPTFRHLLPK